MNFALAFHAFNFLVYLFLFVFSYRRAQDRARLIFFEGSFLGFGFASLGLFFFRLFQDTNLASVGLYLFFGGSVGALLMQILFLISLRPRKTPASLAFVPASWRGQLVTSLLSLIIAGALAGMAVFGESPALLLTAVLGLANITILCMGVVRFKLMSFDLDLRWRLAYTICLFFIAVFIGSALIILDRILLAHMNAAHLAVTFVAAFVFSFLFEPIKDFAERLVDRVIFGSPDLRFVLSTVEGLITDPTDVDQLALSLSHQINSIFGTSHAGFAVWDYIGSSYRLHPKDHFRDQILRSSNFPVIDKTDFLVRTLETEKRLFWNGMIQEEEVTNLGNRALPGGRTTFWKIRRTMRWLGAAICIPILHEGDQLMGFIILGKKTNSLLFNDEDKRFLWHLSNIIKHPIQKLVVNK